jgi:hypothetical protein
MEPDSVPMQEAVPSQEIRQEVASEREEEEKKAIPQPERTQAQLERKPSLTRVREESKQPIPTSHSGNKLKATQAPAAKAGSPKMVRLFDQPAY